MLALKNKEIINFSCGGQFAIALGPDKEINRDNSKRRINKI